MPKETWMPAIYSQSSGYGIRALVHLARVGAFYDGRYVLSKHIARAQKVPPPYLALLLQRLTRAGILRSRKGPKGGFAFRELPDKVDLFQIIGAIDGIPDIERCALGYATCSCKDSCPMHEGWGRVRGDIRRYLDTTVSELAATESAHGR